MGIFIKHTMTPFQKILEHYRKYSFSQTDKGNRFERLMKAYLLTDPKYASRLDKVWLWNEFPGKLDFGGHDIGIDLVARTTDDEYWAFSHRDEAPSSELMSSVFNYPLYYCN